MQHTCPHMPLSCIHTRYSCVTALLVRFTHALLLCLPAYGAELYACIRTRTTALLIYCFAHACFTALLTRFAHALLRYLAEYVAELYPVVIQLLQR